MESNEVMWKRILNIVIYALLIIITVALQSTFAHEVAFLGVTPQIVLIVVVSIAILEGRTVGAVFGCVAGIVLDVVISHAFGVNAILFMWIGFIIGWIYREFYNIKYKAVMIFCILADLIYSFAYYFLTIAIWGNGALNVALWKVILPELIMTTIFCLPIFWLMQKINSLLARR